MIARKSSFSRALLDWFDRSARVLPWRAKPGERPDPYHVLLSETMLQQTQVSTVIEYFNRFTQTYPTLQSLAAADEQGVLKLWEGLGYYSRARNLLAAARAIVERHGGVVPAEVQTLRTLPGVGRYTAGAVASIAYQVRTPVVDGNVRRVLCRLDLLDHPPDSPAEQEALWSQAESLVPDGRPGDFNQALMELGATICVARNPKCLLCPVQRFCMARAQGRVDQLPRPKVRRRVDTHRRVILLVTDHRGRWLLEQRPPKGRWAGLWQFPTFPTDDPHVAVRLLAAGASVGPVEHVGSIAHRLTHRAYRFEVHRLPALTLQAEPPLRWVERVGEYPLPKPHAQVAALVGAT